jgi:NTP pyrophosphatase (non-canonical NTP hydrolase)
VLDREETGVAFTITARQRWALYEQIRNDLTGIGDLVLAFERGEVEEARRLRDRYVQELRLLDDLGWAENDDGTEIAMDAPRLAATLRCLSHAAADAARVHTHESQGAQNAAALSAQVCQEIGDVLADLVILGDQADDAVGGGS